MLHIDFDSAKADFAQDGFVILRNYLSADETAEMRNRLDDYLKHKGPIHHKDYPIGSFKSLDQHDDWFHDYLEKGPHIPLMKHLIEDDLAPDNVTWNDKPQGMQRTLPHFDALGAYRMPPSGISLWIAMDPIDQNNGCLCYEKGSHKRDYAMAYPLPDYDENNENAVSIEVSPGDAVIHSAKTVHWSKEQVDFRPRNAMVYVYWGASSEIDPSRVQNSRSVSQYRAGKTI
tara:strand:- start:1407 stop:2096 length:690 start_codon:yes stop_codon:yes gene_type:complete